MCHIQTIEFTRIEYLKAKGDYENIEEDYAEIEEVTV
jgi:hypothetical protein